ncbi:hypothetical protein GP486_007246, partial [Trichoglossum hirsutum]
MTSQTPPVRSTVTRSTSPFSNSTSGPDHSHRSLPSQSTHSSSKTPSPLAKEPSTTFGAAAAAARKPPEPVPGPGPESNTDSYDERVGADSDTIQVAYHRSNHAMAKAHLAELSGGPVSVTSKNVNGEIAIARDFTPPPASEDNDVNPTRNGEGMVDDGSSSLSEIEDGVDEDDRQHRNGTLSEAAAENDSEAETERLESSPQRIRKRRNVVLSSGESAKSVERSPSKLANETMFEDTNHVKADDVPADYDTPMGGTDQRDILEQSTNETEKIEEDNASTTGTNKSSGPEPDQTTAPTSLDSAGEGTKDTSPPEIVGKKRKRTSPRNRSGSDYMEGEEPARKRTGSIKGEANGNETDKQGDHEDHDTVKYNGTGTKANAINGDSVVHREPESNEKGGTERDEEPSITTKTTKTKKGKRKEKKSKSAAQNRPEVDPADAADMDEVNGEEPS